MTTVSINETLNANIEKVWSVVTTLKEYKWRSDIKRIEIVDEMHFIEYSQQDIATHFTITETIPYQRWEFDVENDNIKGHWIGVFTSIGENTQIEFSEQIEVKKKMMKPFVKSFLKQQQNRYINDLKKAIAK